MNNTNRKAVLLCKQIYELNNGSGGELHIVLDDGNTKDSHLIFSLRNLSEGKYKELYENCILELIKLNTERRRDTAIGDAWELYMDDILNRGE